MIPSRQPAIPIEERLLERCFAGEKEFPERLHQRAIPLGARRLQPEPVEQGGGELTMHHALERAQHLLQLRLVGERQKAFGEARQVPQQRVGLAAECV
jgi:hypothetical protein